MSRESRRKKVYDWNGRPLSDSISRVYRCGVVSVVLSFRKRILKIIFIVLHETNLTEHRVLKVELFN